MNKKIGKLINKLIEFFRQNPKLAIIVLIVSTFVFVGLLCIIVVQKRFLSILMIVSILIWCNHSGSSSNNQQHYSTPEEQRILRISKALSKSFCDIFNQYSAKLYARNNEEFIAVRPKITPNYTTLSFYAKAQIGDAEIFIKQLKSEMHEIRFFVFRKVVNCVDARTIDIDVNQFIEADVNYHQNKEKEKFCVITIRIYNALFNYYFER